MLLEAMLRDTIRRQSARLLKLLLKAAKDVHQTGLSDRHEDVPFDSPLLKDMSTIYSCVLSCAGRLREHCLFLSWTSLYCFSTSFLKLPTSSTFLVAIEEPDVYI